MSQPPTPSDMPISGDTIGALLAHAEQRLRAAGLAFGHGTTNAHDEAAWLLLWCLGLPLDSPLDAPPDDLAPLPEAGSAAPPASVFHQPVTQADQERVAQLIEERIRSRKPAAYLTRQAWLQGVPFYVDERAIVPRSLIAELLADASIDPWLHANSRRVLDLCTGNGSLAVLAAMAWPEVEVTGADLSADALAVAQINIQQHGLQERITLVQGDGLAAAPGPGIWCCATHPTSTAAAWPCCPPNTAPSRRWRWPAAKMAWTSSASCCSNCRRNWPRTACWCWRSATKNRF